jgi:hypothetical protein
MGYATRIEVQRYLAIDDTADDVLLRECIDRASDIMDTKAKRVLGAAADTTRSFTVGRDTDGAFLYFDDVVASITTVTNGDAVEVTSSEYQLLNKNDPPYYGIKILPSANKSWEENSSGDNEDAISVAGKWGYFDISSAVPDDLNHFCIRLSGFLYRQRAGTVEDERPIITDVGVSIMPSALIKDLQVITLAYGRR